MNQTEHSKGRHDICINFKMAGTWEKGRPGDRFEKSGEPGPARGDGSRKRRWRPGVGSIHSTGKLAFVQRFVISTALRTNTCPAASSAVMSRQAFGGGYGHGRGGRLSLVYLSGMFEQDRGPGRLVGGEIHRMSELPDVGGCPARSRTTNIARGVPRRNIPIACGQNRAVVAEIPASGRRSEGPRQARSQRR